MNVDEKGVNKRNVHRVYPFLYCRFPNHAISRILYGPR